MISKLYGVRTDVSGRVPLRKVEKCISSDPR
jgi:hypothetical protein